MKFSTQILLSVGFITAALLGGLAGLVLISGPVTAAPLPAVEPPVVFTALKVPEAMTTIFLQPVKVTDIGRFKLQSSVSLVEITHQGRLRYTGAPGALFELRVDDKPAAALTGQFVLAESDAQGSCPARIQAVTFSGYWNNLDAGEHTISLWASEYSGGLIEGRVYANPGDFPGSIVVIQEFLASQSTYLPAVQR